MIVLESLSNREPIHPAKSLLGGLFFGLSFVAHESSAAQFDFQSSLASTASSVWKTNQINESGNNTEAESTLAFNPAASLTITGRQVNIHADFGVQHRIFSEAGASTTIPEVELSALSRFFGNNYTVGAIARSSARIDNANSSVDGTVVGVIEGLDDIPVVFNFEVQQHATTRVGSRAVLRARHSSAISQSTLDSDIGSNSHALELASDALLTRTGLIGSVRGGYQLTSFENDTQGFNSRLISELQFPLSAAVTMGVAAGYEWFRSDQTEPELAGEVGYLGFVWNPTMRLSTELGYGQRIFGESPRAIISYTARRSGLSLSWTRGLQSNRLSDIAEDLDATTIDITGIDSSGIDSSGIDGNGIGADAINDEDILNFNGLDFSSPFLNQQRSVNEIVTLQMFFNTLRTSYTAVFAYVENEQIEESGVDGISEIARLQAVRKFGRSLDIGLEGAFSSEVDESDVRSTRRILSLFTKWRF